MTRTWGLGAVGVVWLLVAACGSSATESTGAGGARASGGDASDATGGNASETGGQSSGGDGPSAGTTHTGGDLVTATTRRPREPDEGSGLVPACGTGAPLSFAHSPPQGLEGSPAVQPSMANWFEHYTPWPAGAVVTCDGSVESNRGICWIVAA